MTRIHVNSRDGIYALLNLEEADRVGYVDFFWPETVDRWRTEGLPRTASLQKYFGMDIYVMGVDVPPKFDAVVLRKDVEWVELRDSFGVRVRSWRGRSGTPLPVAPAVESLEDFIGFYEPLLDPELPFRISSNRYPYGRDLEETVVRLQEDFFVVVGVLGPFEYFRHIVGEGVDRVLRLFYRGARMLRYIFDKVGRLLAEVARVMLDAGVDGVWDDLAYKNGPFISPRLYGEFVMP